MTRLTSELVLTLIDRVSGPSRGVNNALDRLDRNVRMTSADVGRMGMAQASFVAGAAGSAALLGPAAAAFGTKQVVSAAADFESALTEIQKKAGLTADETNRVGQEILELASSGRVAVPLEEIFGAYERGAAAGIPTNELREFAELSVKASDAFEMQAEAVGNFTSKLKTGLRMSDQEVRDVLDLTNTLADSGISNERDIVEYVDRTAASLRTLGMSTRQTLALGATMLNIGMSAEVASTGSEALANRILTVGTLTGKHRKTFERYMGSVEDFSHLVATDANGALLTMLDKLQALNSTDRMEFLTSFVGREHAGKVLRLSEAVEEYRRNLALAEDEGSWRGSLDAAYQLKLDDFWSQWQIVKNALRELTIDTGTMGMPAFKAALEAARSLIDDVDAGLRGFRAQVDTAEIRAARNAVAELVTELAAMAKLGGSEGDTAIERWFSRLASTANMVSNGVNIVKDGAQALGLVEADDDDAAARAQRRSDFIDNYADFNPYLGERMREFRDWYTGDRVETARATGDASLAQASERANAIRSNQALGDRDRAALGAAERHRDAKQAAIAAQLGEPAPARAVSENQGTEALQAAARVGELQAKVEESNALARSFFNRQLVSAEADLDAITTGMPEAARAGLDAYAAAVAEGGGAITAQAQAIGSQVQTALSVTARPTIDTTSLDEAQRKVEALARDLQAIPGLARAASRAAQAGASADFDGVFADIEE